MADLLEGVPDCEADPECQHNCCANQWMTPIFFVAFVVVAQFILLNVVVVRGLGARVAAGPGASVIFLLTDLFGPPYLQAVLMKNLTESLEADEESRALSRALDDAAAVVSKVRCVGVVCGSSSVALCPCAQCVVTPFAASSQAGTLPSITHSVV